MLSFECRSNSASLTSGVEATAQMDHGCRNWPSEPGPVVQLPSDQHLSKEYGDQDQDSLGKEDAADGVGVGISETVHQQVLADESFYEDFDDGCDGELIIDVEDDKHVSHPTTSIGLTSDEDRTPTLAQGSEQNIYSGIRHRNGTRNEAQQKMEEGKQWLTKSLMFVNAVLCVVPLSLIEEAYQTYCRETKKEPLTTPVLARLIRALYPRAVKCRLGSRGNQRIHYRCLKLKSLMSQSSVGMPESVKMSNDLSEARISISSPVNDCVSLTVGGTTGISVQENQHSEDCVQGNAKSEELSAPVDDKQNINHAAAEEKSDENQVRKACTVETPNQENLKSHITLGDDQVCQLAAQELSQELFVPDEDDKHHINHGAPGEKSSENQGRKAYTTETPNQKNLNSLITVDDDQKVSHPATPRLPQEFSEPDEENNKPHKNHGATGEKCGEKQDMKESSTEISNQKNLNSFITVDDDQEGCQPTAPRLSQDIFASDKGNDKQHISHSDAREKSCENQDTDACTTETPNQTNPKSHNTIDDDEEGCQPAAERLSQVLRWIFSQGRKDVLFREFAHSASCKVVPCTPLCSMFRRVRRHVVAARHSCSVLRIYSVLLRLHVSSCNNSDCGLPACPALRATRPAKRSLTQQGNSSKRSAMQRPGRMWCPSTLELAPRSPESSLPGSPVNSPPASPEHCSHARDSSWLVQSGQVQYVIVPVMPVVMPFSDNRGV